MPSTILIVDDNLANLSVLFDHLRGDGYKIIIAQSGESALERLNHIAPDLILLDILMPAGIDGYETLRRLQANKKTCDIPVIFLTALDDVLDEVKGLSMGAVDYIAKPIQIERALARIRTHLRLRKLQRDLQLQNAELDAFAHTVAHDLRSPLAIILGYAEAFVDSRAQLDNAEQDRMAQAIWETGQTAVNIVDELLLLATVRKRDDVATYPLDMKRIIGRAKRRMITLINSYHAEIIEPETWPSAIGYHAWIEEVWVNYLSNGLKYGGQPSSLELGAAVQTDGMVRFWVKDNGAGLTPEKQALLFTEFTRLNEIQISGHGLGLSIVKRIIGKLGGRVGVESVIGAGSLFYFELPASTA